MAGAPLPDDDDRHVLAAALAAGASVLCTSNTRDFPAEFVEQSFVQQPVAQIPWGHNLVLFEKLATAQERLAYAWAA